MGRCLPGLAHVGSSPDHTSTSPQVYYDIVRGYVMLDLSSVHGRVGPINHDDMAHVCATCVHMGRIILRNPHAIVRTGIAIVIVSQW